MNLSHYKLLKTGHQLADEQLVTDSCSSSRLISIWCGPWLLSLSWVASIIIVAASAFALASARCATYNDMCIDSAWDHMKANVVYEPQVFNPHFEGPLSKYMGEPGPALDHHWYQLSKMFNFGVDRSSLLKINKTGAAAEFPGTGKYQASLMAFHQLHCLNYVRMYSNQTYYEKIDFDMQVENPDKRRKHKDHCIEQIRRSLMCTPDLNIYSYHWVSYGDRPEADLHTVHKRCINWDQFYQWSVDNTYHSAPLLKPAKESLSV